MTFGIKILNGNNNIQVDSDSTGKGFIVRDSGSGTKTSYRVDPKKELVFAKPSTQPSTGVELYAKKVSESGGKVFIEFYSNPFSTITCDYIVAEVATDFTASTTGYGAQIFNVDGDLVFDTGLTTGDGGINISDYMAAGDGSGDYDLLDTDKTKYSIMNSSFVSDTNYDQYFGYWYGPRNSVQGIYYIGEVWIDLTSINGSLFSFPVGNSSAIFLAEGGSV